MQTVQKIVPQPKPLSEITIPKDLPKEPPKPVLSPVAFHHLSGHEGGTLAVIYKRTYLFHPERGLKLADEQAPLLIDGERHEPLYDVVEPSWKIMPEIVAVKSGTDVVIRGHAIPRQPVPSMDVGFKMGEYIHRAKVFGDRFVDTSPSGMTFTPPEPFEKMPLRYENAYGGGDYPFEDAYIETVNEQMDNAQKRRVTAVAEHLWGDFNLPLRYPRNRFGKGYIIAAKRAWCQGRTLPNIERPDDLLTPQRIISGALENWMHQPLPIGFDYLDSYSFPMVAMIGMPPLAWKTLPLNQYSEVKRRLIPDDFCKGEILTTAAEKIHTLVHPLSSRQASLGLWFNNFTGSEAFNLVGFDPKYPNMTIQLPNEVPLFHLPMGNVWENNHALTLSTVHMDTDERVLSLTWIGHFKMPSQPSPEALEELQKAIKITFKRL